MENGHSCCFDCKRLVACKKRYPHKRTPSSLYPGLTYISECAGFTPMEKPVTREEIAKLCGISERRVYLYLSRGIDYAITKFKDLSGKQFEVKPTGTRAKYAFYIVSEK